MTDENAPTPVTPAGPPPASYPPCKLCGGSNDVAELCLSCAVGNDPFPRADTPHQMERGR